MLKILRGDKPLQCVPVHFGDMHTSAVFSIELCLTNAAGMGLLDSGSSGGEVLSLLHDALEVNEDVGVQSDVLGGVLTVGNVCAA